MDGPAVHGCSICHTDTCRRHKARCSTSMYRTAFSIAKTSSALMMKRCSPRRSRVWSSPPSRCAASWSAGEWRSSACHTTPVARSPYRCRSFFCLCARRWRCGQAWMRAFAMALINEYRPGAPIGWHRDAPQYDIVAGISLLSACRMKFRPYVRPNARPSTQGRRTATHEILLERRSAYLMRGEARNAYEHHIPDVATLRYSITFRTVRS
jgi:alkylated DNA repair dioxygenase AlkB